MMPNGFLQQRQGQMLMLGMEQTEDGPAEGEVDTGFPNDAYGVIELGN